MSNKKFLISILYIISIGLITALMVWLILSSVIWMKDKGKLPSYKCEQGREFSLVIQGGDSVGMCKKGELYKKRIEYYK